MADVLNFTNSELTSCARLISGEFSEPIVAQNDLARTFELRCRNFPDFHLCCLFLPSLRFQASLAAVFGVLSLVSSSF